MLKISKILIFFPLFIVISKSGGTSETISQYLYFSNLLKKEVVKKNIHNSLIFVFPKEFYASGLATMNLENIDKNDNIYVIAEGEKSNSAIMNFYKNRKYWKRCT